MTTTAAMREMKKDLLAEISRQTVNRRCAAIHRHQIEKAEKLKILPPNYTLEELRALVVNALAPERCQCRYCGHKITAKNFELDHGIPLSRGGQFTLDNADVIDSPCNKKKGSLTREEFSSLLVFLSAFTPEARADVLQRLGIGGRWKR